jgi:Polyketide cyclase / dehydrase and lipid transport
MSGVHSTIEERTMARINYAVGGGLVLGAIGLCVMALPASKRVERTGFVPATPEAVYSLVSSTSGFQTFNPYRDESPNVKITPSGPEAGVGAAFSFEADGTKGTQTITAVSPNQSVTMLIDMGSMGKPVQTFTLAAEKGGTRVTWATESSFGLNPVARAFGLFMDGYLGPTYERGLANLARVAVTPTVAAR